MDKHFVRGVLTGNPELLVAIDKNLCGQFLQRNRQIAGLSASVLSEAGIQSASICGQVVPLRSLVALAAALARLQSEERNRVAIILTKASIDHCFLKGAASSLFGYKLGERILGDLDIAVPPSQIEKAKRMLKQSGYFTCGWSKSSRKYQLLSEQQAALQERGHYQLAMLVRRRVVNIVQDEFRLLIEDPVAFFAPMLQYYSDRDELVFTIEIDLHHSLTANIGLGNFVQDAVDIIVDDVALKTSSLGSTLAHVIFKLYYEAAGTSQPSGSHQYADVFRCLTKISDTEWERFWKLIYEWNAQPAAYYVLKRVMSFANHVPSSQFVEDFRGLVEWSRTFGVRCRDFGDPWDKLWGWNSNFEDIPFKN